jgi:hypothetical protein
VSDPYKLESDDHDSDYQREAATRDRRTIEELSAFEYHRLVEQARAARDAGANAAAGQPAASPGAPAAPAAAPAQPTPSPEGGSDAAASGQRGVLADIGIGLIDGPVDAVRNTLQTFLPEGMLDSFDLPDTETLPGGIAKGAAQFATGFVPALRGLRMVKFLGGAAQAAAAGGVADFLAFDPHEARLSNVAKEIGGPLDNPVTSWLAAQPGDTALEGRVKNVVEGAGLGFAVEGILRSYRWLKAPDAPRNVLADAVASGRVPQDVAESASLALSRQTSLRELLNDIETARGQVRALGQTETDAIIEAQAKGTMTPEQATRVEAAQFRAGQSGEPLVDALRAQGQGELTSLDEMATSNPGLAAKFREAGIEGGTLDDAAGAVRTQLVEADTASRLELLRLPKQLAEKLAKKLDEYAPPHAAEDVAGSAARNAEGIKALPEDTFVPHIKPKEVDVARVRAAIEGSQNLNEVADAIFDSTNIDNISSSEDVTKLLGTLTNTFGDSPHSMRLLGVQTNVSTEKMARDILTLEARETGTDEGTVQRVVDSMVPGVGNLAAKINAIRLLELSLAKRTVALGKTIGLTDSVQAKAEFVRSLRLLTNVNDARAGLVSEMGRGLQSLRIKATDDVDLTRQLLAQIDQHGGDAAIRKAAALWTGSAERMSSRQRYDLLKKTQGNLGGKMALEYWLNSILSNPLTAAVNMISNTAAGLWLPAEHLFGLAAKGEIRRGSREMLRMYAGMYEGFRAALNLHATGSRMKAAIGDFAGGNFRAGGRGVREALESGSAGRTLLTGEMQTVGDGARQFDMPGQQAITGANVQKMLGIKHSMAARLGDVVGTAINLPSRLLSVGDEIAKTINYHMQLNMRALDLADSRGLTGEAAERFRSAIHANAGKWHSMSSLEESNVAGLLGESPRGVRGLLKTVDEQGTQYARYATFTEALAEGSLSRGAQKYVNAHPILRIAVPFIRTPMNLVKAFTQRTTGKFGLGAGGRELRAMIAEGGAAKEAAMGRMVSGAMVWTVAATAAASGRITGAGPRNKDENDALRATGWQPFSMVFTNDDGSKKYVAINRIDPAAMFLGVAATAAETMGNLDQGEQDELASNMITSMAGLLTSKTYFTGLSSILAAVTDPDHRWNSWAPRFYGTLVPYSALVGQLTGDRQIDARPRTNEGFVMGQIDLAIQAAQGKFGTAEARRNMFGEVVAYPPGWGPDIASPFFTTEESFDPIDVKLRELSTKGEGVRIDMTRTFSQIGDGPEAVRLTPQQTTELIGIATGGTSFGGLTMRAQLNNLVKAENFDRLGVGGQGFGPGGQVEKIEAVWRSRVETAKRIFLANNRGLLEEKIRNEAAVKLQKGSAPQDRVQQILSNINIGGRQ